MNLADILKRAADNAAKREKAQKAKVCNACKGRGWMIGKTNTYTCRHCGGTGKA